MNSKKHRNPRSLRSSPGNGRCRGAQAPVNEYSDAPSSSPYRVEGGCVFLLTFNLLTATITLFVFCFLVIVTAETVTVVALKVDLAFVNFISIDEHNVIDGHICYLSGSADFSRV